VGHRQGRLHHRALDRGEGPRVRPDRVFLCRGFSTGRGKNPLATTTGSWNLKLARKIRAQANRLLHHSAYEAVPWQGSTPLPRLTRAVRFEVRLPRSINPADVKEVLFAAGGSKEIDDKWVKLDRTGKRKNRVVYSGTRKLPVGFVHQGRPLIRLNNGREIWAPHGDTYFEVSPARRRGKVQRIRLGFGKAR
jgi:hypothetical protein